MSYNVIVAKLEGTRKHPNADRLALSIVMGYTVVVGLESKDGDVVLLFPDDGQLSEQYCFENSLYSNSELNKNPEAKGYFNSKRRVTAQTFRGSKSEAYVAPISSLKFTGYDLSKLSVGDKFSVLNDIPICNKYITPATLRAAKGNTPKTEAGMNKTEMKKLFPEHMETEQVRHGRDEEFLGLNILTLKKHGTSARSANIKIPVELPLNWFQAMKFAIYDSFLDGPTHLFNFFIKEDTRYKMLKRPVEMKWSSLYGTRRVVKGEAKPEDNCYRTNAHRTLQPHIQKGEIWYYEIVGYEQGVGGGPIMQPACTDKMPKDIQKKFGKTVIYKYSCLPDTYDIYVYRITTRNEDDETYELPWDVVKNRCMNAGVKHVVEFERHLITDVSQVAFLKERIESLTEDENHDPIDPSHPKEGVCVRIEGLDGKVKIKKNKGFLFKCLEGLVKDMGFVDTEEAEGEYTEEFDAA